MVAACTHDEPSATRNTSNQGVKLQNRSALGPDRSARKDLTLRHAVLALQRGYRARGRFGRKSWGTTAFTMNGNASKDAGKHLGRVRPCI